MSEKYPICDNSYKSLLFVGAEIHTFIIAILTDTVIETDYVDKLHPPYNINFQHNTSARKAGELNIRATRSLQLQETGWYTPSYTKYRDILVPLSPPGYR